MAAFRKISVTFWSDSFIGDLTPEQKYFYLYLMTNDKTTQCGIYETSIRKICFDTGYNSETVLKLLDFFQEKNKIRFSKETNEIALLNWVKFNDSNSPKVLSCVEKELKNVKNRVLIQYLYSMDTESQEEEEEEKEEKEEKEEEEYKSDEFEIFWNSYGKKVDRVKCEKAWKKLKKQEIEKILETINRYVGANPDIQYRKNPLTYLNGKCFNDELPNYGKNQNNPLPLNYKPIIPIEWQ
jgi:dipeptidyl aminopeptidase/acylaminoacyl peptidase